MSNVVSLWLELIGTPGRAQRLLLPWQGDPAEVLLGKRGAEHAYANPYYRPALDSWDCGLTTRRDLTIWAKHVADSNYHGKSLLRWQKAKPAKAIVVDDWVGKLEQTPQ